jgi:hypothetical protein
VTKNSWARYEAAWRGSQPLQRVDGDGGSLPHHVKITKTSVGGEQRERQKGE